MKASKKESVSGTIQRISQEQAFKMLLETTRWWPTKEQLISAHAGRPSHLHLSDMKDHKK